MARRKRRGELVLRILLWNMWVGNDPRVVRAALILLAGLFRPHLICLQEARRFTGTIPGYRRHAADESKREDATNCITLVRLGVTALDHGPLFVPGKGWSYEGKPKPARTFYEDVVRVAGVVWHVLDVHRCVGGPEGNSPEEWWAEDEVIEAWAHRVPREEPMAIVGDHNDRAEQNRPGTTRDLARRSGVQVLTPGKTLDYALVRTCAGVIRALNRKFRSDHAPTFITLTTKETR